MTVWGRGWAEGVGRGRGWGKSVKGGVWGGLTKYLLRKKSLQLPHLILLPIHILVHTPTAKGEKIPQG